MAALTGQTIASSYEQLLHCDADGGLTTSLQAIKDGDNGITSALKLARDKVEILPSGADSTTAFEVSQNDGTAILTVNSSSPTVTITGDGVVTDDLTLNSDASVLTFGAGSDVTFTHDNGTGMDVASAGDFDIAVSAGNGTFTVADTKTLILGQTGASELKLSPNNTAGSELASLINTAGTTDGSDAAGSILLSAVAGGIGLAWADGKDLWAEGGRFVVTANENAADCIKLHADAGTSQAITLINDEGTGATEGSAAIQLLASAGGVNIKGNVDAANAVLLTADGGTSATMVVHNDQSTVDGAAAAGSILLVSDAGGLGLSWADGKDLWAEGGRAIVTANEDAAGCIKLHADDGTSQTILLQNDAGNTASAINLVSTAGGITLAPLSTSGVTVGVDDTGADVRVYSATTNEGLHYDASEDELGLLLTTKLKFHDIGGGEEIYASANGHLEVNAGTTLDITAPTVDINAATAVTIDGPAHTFASSTSAKPLVIIKNTTNDTTAPTLRFVMDKGAAGADGDDCGTIEFYGDDDNQDNIAFAKILAEVADASNGAEGGKLTLGVASHDGEMNDGLILSDGSAEDEIDVTICNGTASVLTVAGHVLPATDDGQDLGSASYQWRNIYTGDLNLNNTRGDGNEVDGTSGSWTIQEGSDNLFLINRNTDKKYKFKLEEIE